MRTKKLSMQNFLIFLLQEEACIEAIYDMLTHRYAHGKTMSPQWYYEHEAPTDYINWLLMALDLIGEDEVVEEHPPWADVEKAILKAMEEGT